MGNWRYNPHKCSYISTYYTQQGLTLYEYVWAIYEIST